MSGARTEQPTPRRLREARRRGDVARSRLLPGAAALAAGLAALALAGPRAAASLASLLRAFLEGAATTPATGALASEALAVGAAAAAPLLVAPAVAAAAVAWAQVGPILSLEPLRPRLDRLDAAAGLRRLLGPGALGLALLGLGRAAIVAALLGSWLTTHGSALAQLPRLHPAALWRAVPIGSLAARLALAVLALGALDRALAGWRHRRALMMTREEVRREVREQEGDPHRQGERRRLHRELLESTEVAKATVVVVNPTHVAVALRHRRGLGEAPRLVAKGTGAAAARIRVAAQRAGVPIVRDPALARAVARLVELGAEIPAELYEAAAAVLVHVHGLDGAAP